MSTLPSSFQRFYVQRQCTWRGIRCFCCVCRRGGEKLHPDANCATGACGGAARKLRGSWGGRARRPGRAPRPRRLPQAPTSRRAVPHSWGGTPRPWNGDHPTGVSSVFMFAFLLYGFLPLHTYLQCFTWKPLCCLNITPHGPSELAIVQNEFGRPMKAMTQSAPEHSMAASANLFQDTLWCCWLLSTWF